MASEPQQTGRVRVHQHHSGYNFSDRSFSTYAAATSKRNQAEFPQCVAVSVALAALQKHPGRLLYVSSTVHVCSIAATAAQLLGVEAARFAANIPGKARAAILADTDIRFVAVSSQMLHITDDSIYRGVRSVVFSDLLAPWQFTAGLLDRIGYVANHTGQNVAVHMTLWTRDLQIQHAFRGHDLQGTVTADPDGVTIVIRSTPKPLKTEVRDA